MKRHANALVIPIQITNEMVTSSQITLNTQIQLQTPTDPRVTGAAVNQTTGAAFSNEPNATLQTIAFANLQPNTTFTVNVMVHDNHVLLAFTSIPCTTLR